MALEKVEFKNSEGNNIAARIERPDNRLVHSYAIFAHCFTCNKNLSAVRNISKALLDQGFAVLRFDFTGLGESEGDFADTNFSSNLQDLYNASDFLSENFSAPSLLVGHSLGGAAVLFAASNIPSIRAVATIGAPSGPKHVSHLFSDGIGEINSKGIAEVNIGGRPFNIKKQFLDDISAYSIDNLMNEMRKPLLVMHSPQDTTVGIENAAEIYKHAWHPKSFVSLDGADHLLSNKADSLYAGQMIGTWAAKYLSQDANPIEKLKSDSQAAAKTKGSTGFTTQIKAGDHQLIADEPASVGGANLGPSPYDLLTAALASCSSMTMMMYAKRKEWPLDEAIVHVNHNRIHSADCEDCNNNQSYVDTFIKEVEIKGELDEKQRQRLFEIASKCPVHKSLLNKIEIRSSLI